MIPTTHFVEDVFKRFNKKIFGGKLPPIPLELSRSHSHLGQFCFIKDKSLPGEARYYGLKIRISTVVDLPMREWEDIVIHEMIHYAILYNHIKDTSQHGREFRHLMEAINTRFGRNITISHKSTGKQASAPTRQQGRCHVIANIRFKDGRAGLKVLPRVLQSILRYYNAVIRDPRTESIKLYLSNNAFFEKYPNSGALKIYYIDPDILEKELEDATLLTCDGKTLHTS